MSIERSLMSEEEARWCVEQIRSGLDGIREAALDLYEREGWRSLGYGSWRECVVAEFGKSQAYLYRVLEAGRIDHIISPIGETQLPESQARELARLKEPAAIREVWQEVQESTPEPTARVIREAVERRINPPQEYVCTDCGQVHPTRECPDCSQSQPSEPRVRDLVSVPPVPEISPEKRIWNRLSDLSAITRHDPIAIARECPDSQQARMILSQLPQIQAWSQQFLSALEEQARGALRLVNDR